MGTRIHSKKEEEEMMVWGRILERRVVCVVIISIV